MEETIEQQQVRMAGYMLAIARTLGGRQVDHDAFIDRIELIVAGSAANLPTLLHWGARVRATGLPILLFSPGDTPAVPQIALVAHVGHQTHVMENCLLWMGGEDDRAHLIPDNFRLGAFVLNDDLRVCRTKRSPAPSFKKALPGIRRAYSRLIELEIEERERGGTARLPSLIKAIAA